MGHILQVLFKKGHIYIVGRGVGLLTLSGGAIGISINCIQFRNALRSMRSLAPQSNKAY